MMKTIEVIAAKYIDDYKLIITFSDQAQKLIDFEPFIRNLKVSEYLKYQKTVSFKRFKIENGNLVWGKDWDIIFSPSQLYHQRITGTNLSPNKVNTGNQSKRVQGHPESKLTS
jgi:hypothetical protein